MFIHRDTVYFPYSNFQINLFFCSHGIEVTEVEKLEAITQGINISPHWIKRTFPLGLWTIPQNALLDTTWLISNFIFLIKIPENVKIATPSTVGKSGTGKHGKLNFVSALLFNCSMHTNQSRRPNKWFGRTGAVRARKKEDGRHAGGGNGRID